MGRPRKTEDDAALARAVRAFWRNGFDATSTRALVEATGVGSAGLYQRFGSKQQLFHRALVAYRASESAGLVALLESDVSVREAFAAVLQQAADGAAGMERCGCLMVNTAVELGESDPVAADIVRANVTEVVAAFARRLRRAMRDGELSPGRDPDALAWLMFTQVTGLRVAARVLAEPTYAKRTIAATLAVLD